MEILKQNKKDLEAEIERLKKENKKLEHDVNRISAYASGYWGLLHSFATSTIPEMLDRLLRDEEKRRKDGHK